jgi:hypothetical protein
VGFSPGIEYGGIEGEEAEEAREEAVVFEEGGEGFEGGRTGEIWGGAREARCELGVQEERGVGGCGEEGVEAGGSGEGAG